MLSGRRIFADFKVFSRGYMRNKFGLFFGLIFPVILILIFGAIFSGGGSGTITMVVQNRDTGVNLGGQTFDVSTAYLDAINATGTLRLLLLVIQRILQNISQEIL